MNIEKYSCYEFQIEKCIVMANTPHVLYCYEIYDPTYKPSKQTVIRESEDYFKTEQTARFAAIGHINLLENGEG